MKSHEYAEKLKAAAEFLLTRKSVEMTDENAGVFIPLHFYVKEQFVSAVKAFGAGQKKWTDDYLEFTPNAPCEIFQLSIRRVNVCRLVRPAEYDCEPILSEAEAAAL